MWSFYCFHFDKNNSFTGSALQTSHNITTPIVNTFLKLLFPMKKKVYNCWYSVAFWKIYLTFMEGVARVSASYVFLESLRDRLLLSVAWHRVSSLNKKKIVTVGKLLWYERSKTLREALRSENRSTSRWEHITPSCCWLLLSTSLCLIHY